MLIYLARAGVSTISESLDLSVAFLIRISELVGKQQEQQRQQQSAARPTRRG